MKDSFFMGGTTPNGFSTQLTELINNKEYHTYILKGGPGTGKSSLMKKVAERFSEIEDVTCYYCSADPDSLDAVELHDSKTIIVDGTPPHVFEPGIPGVCQTMIDLGQYWDRTCLEKYRGEIIRVSESYRSTMAGAANYSRALGLICDGIFDRARGSVDRKMIDEAAQRFCSTLFEKRQKDKGRQNVRQLSVMTQYGYMTLLDTIGAYSNICILDDTFFAASDMFIEIVAGQAVERGYDVKLSLCLLCDQTVREHLLIDEISTALITADPLTQITIPEAAHKDLTCFYDKARMQANGNHPEADRSLLNSIAGVLSGTLADAKRLHDELEQYYINAMDFAALDSVCGRICEETEQRRHR